jgi:hypothetical protein
LEPGATDTGIENDAVPDEDTSNEPPVEPTSEPNATEAQTTRWAVTYQAHTTTVSDSTHDQRQRQRHHYREKEKAMAV